MIQIKRVYDPQAPDDGARFLVDAVAEEVWERIHQAPGSRYCVIHVGGAEVEDIQSGVWSYLQTPLNNSLWQ